MCLTAQPTFYSDWNSRNDALPDLLGAMVIEWCLEIDIPPILLDIVPELTFPLTLLTWTTNRILRVLEYYLKCDIFRL